jgi:hypothetical protein
MPEGDAINDQGTLVGHGFLWTPTALNTTTGHLSNIVNGGLDGINQRGDYVGSRSWVLGSDALAFAPSEIGLAQIPGGRAQAWAVDINEARLVVGAARGGASPQPRQAVVWDLSSGTTNLQPEVLPRPPEAGTAYDVSASAINDHNVVVGYSDAGRGLLWRKIDGAWELQDIGYTSVYGFVSGINDAEWVVGRRVDRAFVWTQADGMQDLNGLVENLPVGWRVLDAMDVNDHGQIVGSVLFDPDGPGGSDQIRHAMLLTPIPEPAAAALLLCSLVCGSRRQPCHNHSGGRITETQRSRAKMISRSVAQ